MLSVHRSQRKHQYSREYIQGKVCPKKVVTNQTRHALPPRQYQGSDLVFMAFDTTPAAKTEGSIDFLATSSPIAALLMSSWTGRYSESSWDISPITLVVE